MLYNQATLINLKLNSFESKQHSYVRTWTLKVTRLLINWPNQRQAQIKGELQQWEKRCIKVLALWKETFGQLIAKSLVKLLLYINKNLFRFNQPELRLLTDLQKSVNAIVFYDRQFLPKLFKWQYRTKLSSSVLSTELIVTSIYNKSYRSQRLETSMPQVHYIAFQRW